VGEAETTADDPAVAEQLLDLVRVRGGADVEILGTAPEEQVANAAADEIGAMSVLVKAVKDLERVRVDVATGDRML
jgi:hypothetical protein